VGTTRRGKRGGASLDCRVAEFRDYGDLVCGSYLAPVDYPDHPGDRRGLAHSLVATAAQKPETGSRRSLSRGVWQTPKFAGEERANAIRPYKISPKLKRDAH